MVARQMEGYHWKQSIHTFSRVRRPIDPRCRGVEGFRFSWDTTGTWFINRWLCRRNVRGATVERVSRSSESDANVYRGSLKKMIESSLRVWHVTCVQRAGVMAEARGNKRHVWAGSNAPLVRQKSPFLQTTLPHVYIQLFLVFSSYIVRISRGHTPFYLLRLWTSFIKRFEKRRR